MRSKERKKILRHGSFWKVPLVRKECDPNIRHSKWNPYENEVEELDFE